ncbi:MAG: HAMP domain-containing histidine kinase [Desulfobacterales bacterium]|nr:HAMP domain-containing histidine kinase [Desulfobacterales bacterium]
MSLKNRIPRFFRSIAYRLTLWYAGIFSISSCVAFGLFYYLTAQTLQTQVDHDLVEKAGYFRSVIQRNGLMGASKLAVIEAQAAGEKLIFFRLLYPSGEVFASSHMSYWKDVGVNRTALNAVINNPNAPVYETLQVGRDRQKARVLYAAMGRNVILQTGIAMVFSTKFLHAFKIVFIVVMGFIVLFSAVSGWFLVRKTLAGVDSMTRTAQSISGTNLEERVPETGNKDELDLLAQTFNRMLDRIETLIKSIREMSDNIAHDLKSPITRIRGFAELTLVQRSSVDDYRSMASNTIEESDRLLDMINTMLIISRAEAGEGDFAFSRLDISAMVDEACDLFKPVAEDMGLYFSEEVTPGLMVSADEKKIQRAFSNLLDNALKYTPAGGSVAVHVGLSTDNMVEIRVTDTGPGIEPDSLEKIFDRFFRAESSRTSPGTGLGLSLARTIARQHRGDVLVESRPGEGACFILRLPICNPAVI